MCYKWDFVDLLFSPWKLVVAYINMWLIFVQIQLVKLIKACLNENSSKVHIGNICLMPFLCIFRMAWNRWYFISTLFCVTNQFMTLVIVHHGSLKIIFLSFHFCLPLVTQCCITGIEDVWYPRFVQNCVDRFPLCFSWLYIALCPSLIKNFIHWNKTILTVFCNVFLPLFENKLTKIFLHATMSVCPVNTVCLLI